MNAAMQFQMQLNADECFNLFQQVDCKLTQKLN